MSRHNDVKFEYIKIQIASPDRIREWSYGEVKKAETINYRTFRPERDGLFCEKIFGTTRDYECFCGKFKSIRYKGVICDRCGVEVTHSKVRRERMGHIELATPVAHIWFTKNVPSRVGILLDKTKEELKAILNYEKYVVIDPGTSDKEVGDLIDEEEYNEYLDQYGENFVALMGAEALRELLSRIDIEEEIYKIRSRISEERNKIIDKKLIKKLELLEAFKDSGNRPEWMILEVLPIIPSELRPMVQLEGGRFASSDLNDLYRRVINRNNRLRRLQQLRAPELIVKQEKRMLQDAVDALFDNSKKGKSAVKGKGNRVLKSLSDMLRGKTGRFRQNLLGKRVDYSGRSVIIVGPKLKLHQMGLPRKMALELFKPFIMRRLTELDIVPNIKTAKKKIENEDPDVNEALEYVIKEHPVLLNRAPTLHRLGIQAFIPVIVEGKAMQLHPLVCKAFNADFDGDQMAVHVPLSPKAQIESWMLMLSAHNILDPANGAPIMYPTQDMILGLYLLTSEFEGDKGTGKYFSSLEEIYHALDNQVVGIRNKVSVLIEDKILITTPGRVIFNSVLPKGFPFVNYTVGVKEIVQIISEVYTKYGEWETVEMLEKFKELGFEYSTKFTTSISLSDIKVPDVITKYIEETTREVEKVTDDYKKGIITNEERYKKVIELWDKTNEEVLKEVLKELKSDQKGFNPLFTMMDSGARGSKQQVKQLAGMRGLMAKPSGDIIELAIRSNFKKGLGVLEFFISTHGARKGLADTALKTADAGYLTRRLVDIAQDVIVTEEDCGTTEGLWISPVKEADKIIVSLGERCYGRVLAQDVLNPITGEIEIKVGTMIDKEIGRKIDELGIEKIYIRSILTCETRKGICAKCYGLDLARLRPVELGEAVGIIAAQSIGQPGTQLTMRTFHVGGVATNVKLEENEYKAPTKSFIKKVDGIFVNNREGKRVLLTKGTIEIQKILMEAELDKIKGLKVENGAYVTIGQILADEYENIKDQRFFVSVYNGVVYIDNIQNKFCILDVKDTLVVNLKIGAEVLVNKGDFCNEGDVLARFDVLYDYILAEEEGKVHFENLIEGENVKVDEQGNKKVERAIGKNLKPKITIVRNNEIVKEYLLNEEVILEISDGDEVVPGDILCKEIAKKEIKTRDITGGLPRVEELFEARVPKKSAVLAPVSGIIEDYGEMERNKRIMYINPFEEIERVEEQEDYEYDSSEFTEDENEDVELYQEETYREEKVIKKHYSYETIYDEDGRKKIKIKIPVTSRVIVRNGQAVNAGELLTDGQLNPHDILRIKGLSALHEFLMQEIQEVYRLQGVSINDKHLEVIVRQMLRKVEIIDAGDTNFVVHQQVDKFKVLEENKRVVEAGGEPCKYRYILLGLTRASLNTDSFLSSASFQETTKVLTDAAIKGKVDELIGLKENVIIGHLIPAGTGLKKYRDIEIFYKEYGDIQKIYREKQLRLENDLN